MIRSITCVAVAALMGLTACDRFKKDEPVVPATPAPAAQQQGDQPAPVPPIAYACESGTVVHAQYADANTAVIHHKDQAYTLQAASTANGVRYVGSGMEWWTASRNGQEVATLSRLGPNDAIGAAVLERCARPAGGAAFGDSPGPIAAGQGPLAAIAVATHEPCKAAQIKIALEAGVTGNGTRSQTFSLQNTGAQPCSITGAPVVALLDQAGRGLTAIRSEVKAETTTPVNLAPQDKAYFDLGWTGAANEATTCPAAATVSIKLPSDTTSLTQAFGFNPCGGQVTVGVVRVAATAGTATPAA